MQFSMPILSLRENNLYLANHLKNLISSSQKNGQCCEHNETKDLPHHWTISLGSTWGHIWSHCGRRIPFRFETFESCQVVWVEHDIQGLGRSRYWLWKSLTTIFSNQRSCFVYSIPNDNIVCSAVDALLQFKRCKLELEIFMFSIKWDSPCAVQFVGIHGVMIRRYDFTVASCVLLNAVGPFISHFSFVMLETSFATLSVVRAKNIIISGVTWFVLSQLLW